MSEKPLHVKVAEALGWSAWKSKHGHWIVTHGYGNETRWPSCEEGFGHPHPIYDSTTGQKLPESVWWDECPHVPHFDTDWSATGPLIDRFGIGLQRYGLGATEASRKAWPNGHWSAIGFPVLGGELSAPGQTAILAVCDLIVTAFAELGGLKEAGKLEPETTQASPR